MIGKFPNPVTPMRSRLKYNLEDKKSIEQIGKGFEENKDQIKFFSCTQINNRESIFADGVVKPNNIATHYYNYYKYPIY